MITRGERDYRSRRGLVRLGGGVMGKLGAGNEEGGVERGIIPGAPIMLH